jgi:hypothetical protein
MRLSLGLHRQTLWWVLCRKERVSHQDGTQGVAGTDCRIEARYGAGKAQVTYQGNSRSSEDYPKEQHLGACIRSGLHGLAEGVERDVPKRRRKAFHECVFLPPFAGERPPRYGQPFRYR